jgi:lysophospholipase L1-like esterase
MTVPRIAALGDSITASYNESWFFPFCKNYVLGGATAINHAVGGHSIMSNMDAQTVAVATDDADIIIIALGTNDNDAGDMTALQAEYAENIAELKASNPRATIYAMNVLPRWTDVGGGTVMDRSHIRAAIAAACTAQGITCWDTYTTPWIAAADTSDGTHPTAGGAVKIATEVLARL